MNGKQGVFFSLGMVMLLAGCHTFHPRGSAVELPSRRTLSIIGPVKNGSTDTVKLEEVSPGVFRDTLKMVTVAERGNTFQIEIPGMKDNFNINISSPPIPSTIPTNPIFIQPLTRVLWDEAQAGIWDIKHMQLYISGTVALEYEEHLTGLTARPNGKTVEETLKGTNLTGPAIAGEMITKSTYTNTLYVLETMTPGVALKISPGNWQNVLEVSFDNGTGTESLRFVQDPKDGGYGYFYLEPNNKDKINYGGKDYEVRFDEKKGKPYLMIRTELPPFMPDNRSLPGRRIP
jgi:hypothetical protein